MAASSISSAQFSGVMWQVMSVEGSAVPDPAKSRFEMQADGSFSTSIGCNAMRGKAEVQGVGVSIGPMASTRMACPEPLAALETAFVRALQQSSSFRVDGDVLTFLDASGAEKIVLGRSK